jgi:hypothetical protein
MKIIAHTLENNLLVEMSENEWLKAQRGEPVPNDIEGWYKEFRKHFEQLDIIKNARVRNAVLNHIKWHILEKGRTNTAFHKNGKLLSFDDWCYLMRNTRERSDLYINNIGAIGHKQLIESIERYLSAGEYVISLRPDDITN